MTGSSFSECIVALKQWNESQDSLCQVRASDLQWNLESQDLVTYRKTELAGVPVITGVASQTGLAKGLSERSMWLSLWGKVPRPQEFVQAFHNHALAVHKTRLVFGADEFHFVPGVPNTDARNAELIEVLRASGFAGNEEVDYQGDPKSEEVAVYIQEAEKLAQDKKWRVSELATEDDRRALEIFLNDEFPGRWAREYRYWLAHSKPSRASWLTLQNPDALVLGFSRLAIRGRVNPIDTGWTPGALRLPFQGFGKSPSNKDCCLGPIGVSKSLRGQGAGKVILASVLAALKNVDAGPLCIDWTNAFKYYEPLSFSIVRRYATACKA